MLADLSWPADPLPMPELTEGTAAYWRRKSALTLASRDQDNRSELDAHYPDPTVANDEWDDCPEDDAFIWSEDDERNYRESEHLDRWKDERA